MNSPKPHIALLPFPFILPVFLALNRILLTITEQRSNTAPIIHVFAVRPINLQRISTTGPAGVFVKPWIAISSAHFQ